jgi:hypothetical protein
MLIAIAIVAMLSLGTAVAGKKLITGKDVKNNSIPGKKIRKHTITGGQIKKHSIPISALRSVPKGAKGAPGSNGAPGSPGLTGESGETGPPAFSAAYSIGSPIAITAPASDFQFLGEPAAFATVVGDRGSIAATASIGTAGATIAGGEEKFRVTICFEAAGEVLPLDGFNEEEEEVEPGEIGISPTIPSGVIVPVPVSSGFSVNGPPEQAFEVALGPCVLNETSSTLNVNDRAVGSVLLAGL